METECESCVQPPTCSRSDPPVPPPLPKASPRLVSPRVQNSYPVPNSRLLSYAFHGHCKSVVSYHKPINPVSQEGPLCGIVALAMASQLFCQKPCTAEEILAAAMRSNYTKSGEMFSARDVASLAESFIGCKATVVTDLMCRKREILGCICNDGVVLIPYDSDRNHEPCLNNGKTAHWAVLNGVCFSTSEYLPGADYECWSDARIFALSSGKQAEGYLNDSIKTCVYAMHGKSKNVALWDFDALLGSNRNLYEATTKYGLENLLLPSVGDALCELRDKAVLLQRKISE